MNPVCISNISAVFTGYGGAKVEMHTGVHHTVPAYPASLPAAPQPQVRLFCTSFLTFHSGCGEPFLRWFWRMLQTHTIDRG